MNKNKTKTMCNKPRRRRPRLGIVVDDETLEEVNEYKYLGRLMTPGSETSAEIYQNIATRWQRFGQYSKFLKDINMLEGKDNGHSHTTSNDIWS